MPELTDLGWANDWKETPEIVLKCREAGHPQTLIASAYHDYTRCLHRYECRECGYTYREDSGD